MSAPIQVSIGELIEKLRTAAEDNTVFNPHRDLMKITVIAIRKLVAALPVDTAPEETTSAIAPGQSPVDPVRRQQIIAMRAGKVERARQAVHQLRDAAREGIRIGFRERDPLVMAIHDALDDLAEEVNA